jgi:transposase, IS30 family
VLRNIAKVMQRSISTLSEELRLNAVRGVYDPKKAHHKSYVRRKYSKYQGMKIVRHGKLRDFIEERLHDDQSPEAVSGRLKYREKKLPYVSKNSIRRYIGSVYGRRIEAHRAKKKKRHCRRASCAKLQDRTFIEKRPKYIEKRLRVGDAEGDFIISCRTGKGILLVLVDRKLRHAFLEQILRPSYGAVTEALARIKRRYPEWKTMTTDNDLLFQHHKALEKTLHIRIFFCHPYHSWEKGSIENVNRYIRRDIPKGSDISRYSKRFIQKIEEKLNRRPMKCLRYRTPAEHLRACRKKQKIAHRRSCLKKSCSV